jgi:hypothetical protein
MAITILHDLTPVLAALLIALVGTGINYLTTHMRLARFATALDAARTIIDRLITAAAGAVDSTTVLGELKAALGAKLIAALTTLVPDLDTFLLGLIKGALAAFPAASGTDPGTTATPPTSPAKN